MSNLLMPKATAVWLIDNTTLTFEQIAEFCELHALEVKGMADGEVSQGIMGMDPIMSGQITRDEIERCEKNPKAKLELSAKSQAIAKTRFKKKAKYTPIARRQDKPDAISWFARYHPEVLDSQICKLIGTTKNTVAAIKNRTHWNIANIKPRDPVLLSLCTQVELDKILARVKVADSDNKEA